MKRRALALVADDGPPPSTEERDPQFVAALARGLDVLRAFRRGDGPLGNQEIAQRTSLPKPTVSRFTYTLSRLGYLSYLPDLSKYELSAGVLSLGFTALGRMGLRDVARPHMQALADAIGGSVALGTRDRFSMVYVEHCGGDSLVRINFDVGAHLKLASSAMGRAYLAGLPADERASLLDEIARREGAHWPALSAKIEQGLEDVARHGFVVSAGDWKEEISAVAVPLGLGTGGLLFALNGGGPSFVFPRDRLVAELGPKLLDTAARIRAEMDGGSERRDIPLNDKNPRRRR